jgi:SsrA-binding protein
MKITNKKAFYDYELVERIEAGIKLVGAEVKAVRLGHADLTGSHARIVGSEAVLLSAKIFPYKYARPEGYDETRTRKLLLHKKEILSIKSRMDGDHLVLVPVSLYTTKQFIKLELALAKGKKKFEKKEKIKKKDLDRDLERSLS